MAIEIIGRNFPRVHRRCYKLSAEQREEIVRRYSLGENSVTLSKEYGCSHNNICALVKRRGIEIRSGGKLTKFQREQIAMRYKNGENSPKLSKEFGIKPGTIIEIVRKDGQIIREPWDSRGRYTLDHNAFSEPTPEAIYWIGFLMADGYISQKKNSVSLTLASEDILHIEKFRKFVNAQHKITHIPPQKMNNGYTSSGAYSLTFVSRKIINDLNKWGVVHRKSFIAKSIGLENNINFWRGVIDGDGSVCMHKVEGRNYACVSLVGSKDIVNQFAKFVKSICPERQASVRPTGNIFSFKIVSKSALKIIETLYKDSHIYLNRKHKKAIEIINSYNIHQHGQSLKQLH